MKEEHIPKRFFLENKQQFESLLKQLPNNLKITHQSSSKLSSIFFDCFDWRLYQNNLTLYRQLNTIYLFETAPNQIKAQQKINEKKRPEFWWEFPEGDLKDLLEKLIDTRALLEIATLQQSRKSYNILNSDGKIVLKIQLNTYHDQSNHIFSLIEMFPLKGYQEEHTAFAKYLEDNGLNPEPNSPLQISLEKRRISPSHYSTKVQPFLDPKIPAGQACNLILQELFQVMQMNVEGVIKDTDTEFLHDFRVSIRRARALLGQLKDVYPREEAKSFRKNLAKIQKQTNRLRDLDVYLLKKDKYQSMLPSDLQPGLKIFFQDIQNERDKEQKDVKTYLESSAFKTSSNKWEKFIAHYNRNDSALSQQPILDTVKPLIFNQYNKIIQMKMKDKIDNPATKFHRLRIECKRLRYLLEFFFSLFPEKEINLSIQYLKKLQDVLGLYHDCIVQKRELTSYLANLEISSHNHLNIIAALGGLLTELSLEQGKQHKKFNKIFLDFKEKQNADLFNKLFG
jgi:CHAD domain-containing protein